MTFLETLADGSKDYESLRGTTPKDAFDINLSLALKHHQIIHSGAKFSLPIKPEAEDDSESFDEARREAARASYTEERRQKKREYYQRTRSAQRRRASANYMKRKAKLLEPT